MGHNETMQETRETGAQDREQCESCGSTNTQRSATKYVEGGILEFRMCYDCGTGYTIPYEIAGDGQ